LAGTSKRVLCASLIFSRTIRDDFIGTQNDVRAFITDQGSLSTSVLVSDSAESEAMQKSKPNLNFSLINHSPSTLAVVSKLSLLMLVTRGFIFQRHSSSSVSISLHCQSRVLLGVDSHQSQENPDRGGNQ